MGKINKDRETHAKKLFDDISSEALTKEVIETLSSTDRDSGLFYKGEQKKLCLLCKNGMRQTQLHIERRPSQILCKHKKLT